MRLLLAACGTAVCSCACCLLLLCWCLLVACCGHAAQQPNSLLLVASLLRGIAAESSLPIRTGEGAKGGVAPGPETRSDSPNRLLVTNKPKAQLPAEKFSSHFSGPEATADLGGQPPAMCDDMGRSLRVEPLHSVLARAPNQRSGTWPYAPPATSLWVKQVTAIQPEPIPPKDDQQGLRPSSQDHISCCAYDLRTTHKAI